MTRLDGMSFKDQDIRLDGVAYRNCQFEGCRIVFGGHLTTALENNQFKDCTWLFDGPAAQTLQFMSAMHAQGADARTLIEATFQTIRGEAPVSLPTAQAALPRPATAKPNGAAAATH